MPTGRSSTDLVTELRRGTADALAVLAFRRALAGAKLRWVTAGLLLLSVAVAVVPARVATDVDAPVDLLIWLWTALPVLAAGGAIGSGGGRALLPRDEAAAFPLSSVAEHVGSLLLAPLNIAWLVQVWLLVGLTVHEAGAARLLAALAIALSWVALSTALGQLVGWLAEWVRRGPAGPLGQRILLAAFGLGIVGLGAVGLRPDDFGAKTLLAATRSGAWWPVVAAALLLAAVGVALLGVVPARRALALPPRDEERLDSETRLPRPTPSGDHRMLVRFDRASLWRTVPVRRGVVLLALLPLAGAFAEVDWLLVVMLPGLVGSGALLLFGVNTWTLDGPGLVWRESLPVRPRALFVARMRVTAEVVALAALPGVLVLGWRAGPSREELVALACAWAVSSAQLVSAAMRWSMQRPYAVDLRSARATPAPPIVMVGYAARLSLAASAVGLLFGSGAPWWIAVLIATALIGLSARRVLRAAQRWDDPRRRAEVLGAVTSVA